MFIVVLMLVACTTQERNNVNDNTDGVEPTRNNTGLNQVRDGSRINDQRNNTTFPDTIAEDQINDGEDTNRHGRTGNYSVSKEAADRIVDDVEHIDRAYVLMTNRNAYVAAELDTDRGETRQRDRDTKINDTNRSDSTGHDLTDDVKDKIADIVKDVDANIDNVYVTTNPDFADLVHNYMADMDAGKPVRGFFDQFGNMIERVFPQNK